MDQGKLKISAERVRYAGGTIVRTGTCRVEAAPFGFALVTESGRMVEVGDTFKKADGGLSLVPHDAWMPLVHEAFRGSPALAFPVLRAVASALFGWLP